MFTFIKIRHKLFKKLHKSDHIFNNDTQKALCGRVAQWNIHYWDKLPTGLVLDCTDNLICKTCRSLFHV